MSSAVLRHCNRAGHIEVGNTFFSFLRNGNVDIARSEDFLPSHARVALVCVHEDPVFLAYNVPVWNSYRSLEGAIRLSRLSSNLLDSARLKLVFGLL